MTNDHVSDESSFESWAAHPLIVPMPSATAKRMLTIVGIVFLPLGTAIAVLALLPTPQGLSIGHTGWAIAGIAVWWVVGLTWLQKHQRSAVDRLVNRFIEKNAGREMDYRELGELVSKLMAARGCSNVELHKWTRRDFERLRELFGHPLPLVWSIDGFDRDWLQRLLNIPHAVVDASVRLPRSLLGAVRADTFGLAVAAAMAPVLLWAIANNVSKWAMYGGFAAAAFAIYYLLRFVLGRSQWWLIRRPDGVVLSRTNRDGNEIRAIPLDPDSLVIICGVYKRVDRYAHYRILQDWDFVAVRVLGPFGSPAFRFHAPREEGILFDEEAFGTSPSTPG